MLYFNESQIRYSAEVTSETGETDAKARLYALMS